MADDANSLPPFDAALLALAHADFSDLIAQLLRDFHDGKNLALTERGTKQPLAYCSLGVTCLMQGETPRMQVMGLLVQATLRWVIDELWPGPKPGTTERGWRHYAALHYPYFTAETFEQLAERLNVTVRTLYAWRTEGLHEVARRLRQELHQPEHKAQRKHYALAERYQLYQAEPLDRADEQRLLRLCALLRQPLPLYQIQQLAQQIGIRDPQQCLNRLRLDGWLVQAGEQSLTGLADEDACHYLRHRLTRPERQSWSGDLALLVIQQQAYLLAAQYWLDGEHFQQAAEVLSTYFQEIVEAGYLKELLTLHQQIAHTDLDRNLLARLKLAVGRAALSAEHVDTARRLLEGALNAPESLLRAEAYYYLGKTWEKGLPPQARDYFNRGIQLLRDGIPNSVPPAQQIHADMLLANLYIGKAWLEILHGMDTGLAEEKLRTAELFIRRIGQQQRGELNLAVVNLHNALAGQYARQGNTTDELRHYHLAVLAAHEIGDKERLWRMLHNVAQAYIHARQYEPGSTFLIEAERVAQAVGTQEGIGKCLQTRGAYHFFQADDLQQAGHRTAAKDALRQAIAHYQAAAEIFEALGDAHWLTAAYADLAEAYAALPRALIRTTKIQRQVARMTLS